MLFRETLFTKALQTLEKANTDPRLIIRLFPPFTHLDISSLYLYSGIRTLLLTIPPLPEIGTDPHTPSYVSRGLVDGSGTVVNQLARNYDPYIKPSSADAPATIELKRVLLENAQDVLREYLFRFREKKGYASVGEDAKAIFEWVDLVLLQLVLELGREEGRQRLYDLVDSGVDCFDEAKGMLISRERYFVLSRMFQQRGMVRDVLETWAKMIDGTWPDDEFKNGEVRMRDYLIKLKDVDLVFKYGMWLTKRNPEAGVQVRDPPSLIPSQRAGTWLMG